jgi:hypothetical protein
VARVTLKLARRYLKSVGIDGSHISRHVVDTGTEQELFLWCYMRNAGMILSRMSIKHCAVTFSITILQMKMLMNEMPECMSLMMT